MEFHKFTIGLLVIIILMAFGSFINKADANLNVEKPNQFISNFTVGAEIDVKTKAAVGEANLQVLNLLNLTVDTNETFQAGISLTDLLKIGPKNVDVYLKRTAPLNDLFGANANNVVGVTVGLHPQ